MDLGPQDHVAVILQEGVVLRGVGSVALWAITYLDMTPLILATVA